MGHTNAVLRGKSISMSTYMKKTKISNKHLNVTSQTKYKTSKRRKIIKIRAGINETETKKKNIQRINERKIWFFEKINKIDKPMVNLSNMSREKTLISIIRHEKGEITTNTKVIQGIIRDYF
jgi:hypothetical protein